MLGMDKGEGEHRMEEANEMVGVEEKEQLKLGAGRYKQPYLQLFVS